MRLFSFHLMPYPDLPDGLRRAGVDHVPQPLFDPEREARTTTGTSTSCSTPRSSASTGCASTSITRTPTA